MERKRKAVIIGFILFLFLMGVCTLVTKGIYKAGLPRVTVTNAREMSLYHSVSAVGSVAAGQEYGVYAPEGLRVATVAVQRGDSFQAGEPLLQLDTEDLEKILARKELQRQQLICQQKEADSRSARSSQTNISTLARAQEDYETVRRDGELQVSRAREELVRAQAELENARKELVRAQEAAENAGKEEEQADGSGQGTESAGSGEGRMAAAEQKEALAGSVSGGDNGNTSGNGNNQQSADLTAELQQLETRVMQLEQTVRTAEQAVEDALLSQADGLRDAQRSVEDARAAASGSYEAAGELARLEQAYLEEEIRELQELLEREGWICAREDGKVTQLCVSAGQRTPDTAQLLYTPDDGQRLLQAQLTEEQTRYVSLGTRMQLVYETVSGGRQSGEGVVSYMEQQENGGTLLQMDVTGQGLEMGQQVTLKSTWQSESYELVVPVSVLQKDSNGSYFLYTLRQQDGILGTEWHADRVYVNVLDQNSSYAAIESTVLSAETDIILTASADIKDSAAVRVLE